MGRPVYACVNENCREEGIPFVPRRGDEAVCPTCGWMLVAIDEGEGDLVG